MHRRGAIALALLVAPALASVDLGCAAAPGPSRAAAVPSASSEPLLAFLLPGEPDDPAPTAPTEELGPALPPPPAACPTDMVHVRKDFCPLVDRKCLDGFETKDHRHICTAYEPGSTRCIAARREQLDFCIDQFEYPNKEGGHPVALSSWYDATTTCESIGKRLCWEAEWTAACEGPDETPFPSGWTRDTQACNIDLPAQMVLLHRLHARDHGVQQRELARLDRSRPSGSMKGCVSGFGVADMTGNYDEWVNAESVAGASQWGALKGGSWIRSRNQCRGIMSDHGPTFRFHTLSLRCCADPPGAQPRVASGGNKPPRVPPPRRPGYWPGRVLATGP